MYKLKITNTSAERDGGRHARPIFLTEAGRLLQPGDAVPANRLNKGTDDLVEVGDLKVEYGSFPAVVEPKKKKVVSDDDEDDAPRKKDVSNEKATLVDVRRVRSPKIVPLVAEGGDDGDDDKEEDDVLSSGADEDDDLDVPSVTKADLGTGTGLKDIEPPVVDTKTESTKIEGDKQPSSSAAATTAPATKLVTTPAGAGFHDNRGAGSTNKKKS